MFGVGELVADIDAGEEGQKAGARLLSIIDDPLPVGNAVNECIFVVIFPLFID